MHHHYYWFNGFGVSAWIFIDTCVQLYLRFESCTSPTFTMDNHLPSLNLLAGALHLTLKYKPKTNVRDASRKHPNSMYSPPNDTAMSLLMQSLCAQTTRSRAEPRP